MKFLTTMIGLLVAISGTALAQELLPADIVSIERAAAVYVAQTLPDGVIGFDGAMFDAEGLVSGRAISRVDGLAQVLRARKVRADSVLTCAGNPSTCRLSVDALVRVGEPFTSPEGARVVVEVRRHSGIERQPVSRLSEEIILLKADGIWTVIGVGRRSAS